MGTEKDFFDNDPMLRYVLKNFDISSKEAFEKSKEDLYYKLKDKPILNGLELMSLPAEPDNYIIEKMVWKRDVVLILASEKAGKSILGLQMACALTKGGHFLGEYEVPESMRVLYIQAEGSREETQMRLRSMNKNESSDWTPENFFHMYPSSLSLDTDLGYNELIESILKTNFRPDVIFIDPLYMAMQGDLIDNKCARNFCRNIRRLKEQYDCTVIINHHKRRPQKDGTGNYIDRGDDEIMGSFVWKAFPSHILTLHKRPNNTRSLNCETQRGGNVIKNLVLELVEPDPLYFKVIYEKDCKSCTQKIIEFLTEKQTGCSTDSISSELKINPSSVRKSIADLLKEQRILKVNPTKRPALYAIAKEVK